MLLFLLADQSSTSILDDPFFLAILGAVITLLAGLIGAFVTYWVYRKQRSKRELSYQIVSDAPIASVNKDFEDRVKILLDGQQVAEARQIVIKLINTGNVAVRREDYDDQVEFLVEDCEVIGGEVINTEPSDLINLIDKKSFRTILSANPQTGMFISRAVFQKFLLNPKESITFTFLLDGVYKKLDVRGRIVDGKIVKYKMKTSLRFFIQSIVVMLLCIILFIMSFLFSNILISTFIRLVASLVGGFAFGAAIGFITNIKISFK